MYVIWYSYLIQTKQDIEYLSCQYLTMRLIVVQ